MRDLLRLHHRKDSTALCGVKETRYQINFASDQKYVTCKKCLKLLGRQAEYIRPDERSQTSQDVDGEMWDSYGIII
jgi:RNase P subunit RPR2